MTVEFIKYTGKYPNLCFGILKLRINGVVEFFSQGCLKSTGDILPDYSGCIEGDWEIRNLPERLEKYRDEIEYVVNQNVPKGCCGGCI